LVHEARLAREAEALALLTERVESGQIVDEADVPPDLVTMYSQVRLQDSDSGRFYVTTVALPPHREPNNHELLSRAYPAAALLGARVGGEIVWRSGGDLHRARIAELLFQPNSPARHLPRSAQHASGLRTRTQIGVRSPAAQAPRRGRDTLESQEMRT
jgi:regulator of nucleoside diphosphate kinase